jgi:tRNA threonylcarbamoyladenosine biosynthesis protein TsaB
MRILAIETAGRTGSAALLVGSDGLAQSVRRHALASHERTAEALAPAVKQLLTDAKWRPDSVQLVAVALGPGSFTGLRIGVTTAKAFAYAVGAEIIGVNTLAALAAQAPPAPSPLWTILDAQRQELFVAKFADIIGKQTSTDCDVAIVRQDQWLAGLRPGDRVIGPPLRRIADRLPAGVSAVAEELWQPDAAAVGHVAWQAYLAGKRDDLWQLVPNYGRPSYAEEKKKGSLE